MVERGVANMIVNHKINMDLTKADAVPTLTMMQLDQLSRQVQITLLCGEEPFVPPEDTSVLIRYLCCDGSSGAYDTMPDGTEAWMLSGNVLTLKIAPQVLAAAGCAVVSARLIRGQGILNTFDIYIQCEPAVQTGEGAGEHSLVWYLRAPVKASVGQYLMVSGVDENGVVTVLEAGDVPVFDPAYCNLGEVIAQKLRVTGRLSADFGIEVTLNGSRLRKVGAPTEDTDAANKAYVDAAIAAALQSAAEGEET